MADEPVAVTVEPECERVRAWRFEMLVRAGYTVRQAEALADADVDLHYATRLVRVCDRELAFDILL